MPDGESIELETERTPAPVAERFDAAAIKEALREAQALVPGYTYKEFCAKVVGAGCAGYLVSLAGQAGALLRPHRRDPHRILPGAQPAAQP